MSDEVARRWCCVLMAMVLLYHIAMSDIWLDDSPKVFA